MPEYLAPGVYVEETSFRPKSIEGVSTSTTAFVGPTQKGPLTTTPEVITSFGEFTRIYGSMGDLVFSNGTQPNYLAHAVRSFFNNGGSRLFVARTFVRTANDNTGVAVSANFVADGANTARVVAMQPGSGYNGRVRFVEQRVPASLISLTAAPEGSLLSTGAAGARTYYRKQGADWLAASGDPDDNLNLAALPAVMELITLLVETTDGAGNLQLYENLGYAATHPRYLGLLLQQHPSRRADALQNPYFIQFAGAVTSFQLHAQLFPNIDTAPPPVGAGERIVAVAGGNDGQQPTNTIPLTAASLPFGGSVAYSEALALLEQIEDISIIAAPGYSAHGDATQRLSIQGSLIAHVERMQYRIAVLDTPQGQTIAEALATKAQIDSTRSALYYPWVMVENPLARPGNEQIPKEIAVPPSGFITGIYARNDVERGVWKAPANEVVLGALRFEREINKPQQELLNPNGVNCLRYFFGRGNRVWGARTTSSDPEWKYVNVRRYFIYLEHSIDRSTQWAVFEPNGERLWANLRETVAAFLYNEWRNGALLGTTPEEAYFVRCDRSTMTQNDLDNGRLICEIGVAVLYPAEFVIFRIGQKTADARS